MNKRTTWLLLLFAVLISVSEVWAQAYALWPNSPGTNTAPTISGNVQASAMTFTSNLVANTSYSSGTKTVASTLGLVVSNTAAWGTLYTSTGAGAVYEEYKISPASGYTLNMTGVELYLGCSNSGGGMKVQLAYSTDGTNFTTFASNSAVNSTITVAGGGQNGLILGASSGMSSGSTSVFASRVNYWSTSFNSATMSVSNGGSFFLRVYPYYTVATQSMWLCAAKVKLMGNAQATGVLPVVSTDSIANIAALTATAYGNITNLGDPAITVSGFCWSTSANPTVSDSHTTDGGTSLGAITGSLTSLSPATTYHVRAYATYTYGTVYGADVSFTTLSSTPVVTTAATTNIGLTYATSGGNVTASGGSTVTARGVCWSTSANPTLSNSFTSDGTGTGTFTSSITGLTLGTTYHVRAYATNTNGTSYGADSTFTTLAAATLPTVTTASTTNITATSATSGGNVTSDGGATVTERGICWSTSSNPTTADNKITGGSGTGSFSSSITGLTESVTYHVRAYAINSAGTAYGSDVSFLTVPYATGDYGSTVDGNWTAVGTWKQWDGSGWNTTPSVIPTSADNVWVLNNVTLDNSPYPCKDLHVVNGGTLKTGTTTTTGRYIKIYGATLEVNGTNSALGSANTGDRADGIGIDVFSTNLTITGSTGLVSINRLRTNTASTTVTIDRNVTLNYHGSSNAGNAFAYYAVAGDNNTLTINAGKTLTFAPWACYNNISSSHSLGTFSQTININGTMTFQSGVPDPDTNTTVPGWGYSNYFNLGTTSGKTCNVTIGASGTLNVTKLYPNGTNSNNSAGTGVAVTFVNNGVINVSDTADFRNASQVITGTGTINVNGPLLIGSASGISASAASGPIQTTTRNYSASRYEYAGSAAQVTGDALPSSVTNLAINNSAGVTLTNATTVSGTYTMTSGVLSLGSNNLTLNGSVSGTPSATNMIAATGTGVVRKSISSVPTTFNFPLGSGSSYAPISVTLSSGTLASAYISAKAVGTKSSHNTSATDYLNRTWTLTANGITSPVYNVTATYADGDIAGTEANIYGGLYNGSTWTPLGAVDAANNNFTGTGLTSFNEITGGGFGSGHVTVKVIPQGFYNAGGYLNGIDTIRVLLANASTPYAIVDSADVVLDSLTYIATGTFSAAASGNYYIVIKHRNSVETWSASGVTFTKGSTASYDFTTAASQAYGNNETEVSTGVFAIYSGDCNQDGYVDPLDLSLVDQDSFNYVAGMALATDVNGDKYVDPLDLSIVDQNSFNYVGIQRPSAARMISAKERAKTLPYYQNWLQKKEVK